MSLDFLMGSARGGDSARSSASGGSSARTGASSARSDTSGGSTARSVTNGHNIIGDGRKKRHDKKAGKADGSLHPMLDKSLHATSNDSDDEDGRAVDKARQLKIYQKMLLRANPTKPEKKLQLYMDCLTEADRSEHMPVGRVSTLIYDDIWKSRKFDRFGRPVKQKLRAQKQLAADIKASFASKSATGDKHFEKGDGPSQGRVAGKITTAKSRIGFKAATYAPPGLAAPLQQLLNSEGNEEFYSYDGGWKEGEMHGIGKYQFIDKFTYEGDMRNNRPHGEGVAKYPNGHVYSGWWKEGRFHGHGKMEFSSGSVYIGEWKNGKRHGQGKLLFESGYSYEGGWLLGRQHGHGKISSPAANVTYEGTFEKGLARPGRGILHIPHIPGSSSTDRVVHDFYKTGGLSLRDIVEHMKQDWLDKKQDKEDDNQHIYGVQIELSIQEYVVESREEIYEARRAMREESAASLRQASEEKRKKAKEARMAALINSQNMMAEEDEKGVKPAKKEIKLESESDSEDGEGATATTEDSDSD